jgi:hypothetical protein
MRDRNVILFTAATGDSVSDLLERTGFIADSAELILCRTLNGLTESLYNRGGEAPVVILALKTESEIVAALKISSLLQRFDVIVMLVNMDSSLQKRLGPLRPRLTLAMDDESERIELLIKGVMAKNT